jgi:hypothetical protein
LIFGARETHAFISIVGKNLSEGASESDTAFVENIISYIIE